MASINASIWQHRLVLGCFAMLLLAESAVTVRDAHSAPMPPPDPPALKVPDFVSSPIRAKHEKFLRDVIRIILEEAVFFNDYEYKANATGCENGPFLWRSPEDLSRELGPMLELGEKVSTHEELLQIISQVIKYSPRPSHPLMLDKHVAGLDPYALAADWMISTANENGATYYTAPVSVIMEQEIVQQLGSLIGWKAGEIDGITTPGAGAANAMAVTLALQDKFPELKQKGLYEREMGAGLAMFVSGSASPAFEKAAIYQGMGLGKRIIVIRVSAVSRSGHMDTSELDTEIAAAKSRGLVPFMVVGSAGSQDIGDDDDLEAIADICKEHGLWFHVDAEIGGGLIFAPELKWLDGIHLANSVTFGTWMLATPYVTTMLLVQAKASTPRLQVAFGTHARYLYKTGADLYNSSYDTGDGSVQASRRMEVIKLWYSWRARGLKGLGDLVKTVCRNSFLLQDEIQNYNSDSGTFQLVLSVSYTPLVAFNYIPDRFLDMQEETDEYVMELNRVTHEIKAKLMNQNLMQISVGLARNRSYPDFLVASLTNAALQPSDLVHILDLIEAVAESKPLPRLEKRGEPKPLRLAIRAFSAPQLLPLGPLVNAPLRSHHQKFLKNVFDLFLDKGIFFSRAEKPMVYMEPEALSKQLNMSTKLVAEEPASHAEILEDFEKEIKYSPHRGHPYFFFQLLGGFDPYTLAADYVASALNTPMLTYEDSPVFTLMERKAMAEFRTRIFGTPEGDGVVTDGGSMANQMAIALALHVKYPKSGLPSGKKFVGYMSQDAHYSTRKGFILQNLGVENLIEVESNERGQMRPDKLEAAVQRTLETGNVPFFVCITAGTTVYGAIDPVAEIVDVCKKYNLWCHVDGMVGGLLGMSDDHRHRLAGIERVDSFGTDLHKLMGSTLTIAVLITRQSNIFRDVFKVNAESAIAIGPKTDERMPEFELYNRTEWDRGSFHWQTDKRNNVFKFWLLWKAKGRLGFENHVNLVMDNAAYLVQQLHFRKAEAFVPVLPNYDMTNVCFYYVPTKMRAMDPESNEFQSRLGQVSYDLEKVMTKRGVMAVVAQQRMQNSQPAFIKFVMMDSSLTKMDVDYLLDAVAHYGEKITE